MTLKNWKITKFHDKKTRTIVAISNKFKGFIKVQVATPKICK